MNKSYKPWLIAVGVLALVVCLCLSVVCIAGAGILLYQRGGSSPISILGEQPTEVVRTPSWPTLAPEDGGPTRPAGPTATPWIEVSPAGQNSFETLKTLEAMIVPINDPIDLAGRLTGKTGISPTVAAPNPPYQVGNSESFWASNEDTTEHFKVKAVLRYATPHLYFWIEDGVKYNQSELKKLCETFEKNIYPTNRQFFGSEWTPGIDNDVHLYVLYAGNLGSNIAGYYSSADEFPPETNEYSNSHEMFFMNSDSVQLGDLYIYGTMAHEFQHMIHFYRDRNEEGWMNEGFSVLAELLNGYDIGGFDMLFIDDPNLQLNTWADPSKADTSAHYGASFLFVDYFLNRFGEKATQAVVADPENGLDSIDKVLKDLNKIDSATGKLIQADDVFADWAVTNYLNDPQAGDGRYSYPNYKQAPTARPTEEITECPTETQPRSVNQYGTEYIRIACSGKYTLSFSGATEAALLPEGAHSGQYMFWSNKGDESDMTLTHDFDFTSVKGPLTMGFQTWHDIEKGYDYVYLEASEDGKAWQIIKTPSGTDEDPSGNSYGWGYNGETSGWVAEEVDLSKFAGKKVQLRFEYVTDAAVNGEGFLLDDVSIPAVNYQTDFEKDDGGWVGKGFVRLSNNLPQTFRVSLIRLGSEITVEPVNLDEQQSGSVTFDNQGSDEVVLVVSGTTRFTIQPAAYQFTVK